VSSVDPSHTDHSASEVQTMLWKRTNVNFPSAKINVKGLAHAQSEFYCTYNMTVYLGKDRKGVTASITLTHATVPELTTWTGMCNIRWASTISTHLQTYCTIYTLKQ